MRRVPEPPPDAAPWGGWRAEERGPFAPDKGGFSRIGPEAVPVSGWRRPAGIGSDAGGAPHP